MNTYIVEQKITALANQYRVYNTSKEGVKDSIIAFAHQKRFAFKEKVEFFTDESRQTLQFSVKAEKVMDIHGKFIVQDAQNQRIGAVRKSFKASLLRSTWEILTPNDEVRAIVRERSQGIAVFRRLWDFIPYASDIPFFIKYHFDFVKSSSDEIEATYYKQTRFRDHYRLEITDDTLEKEVGWQTLVTQAVLLDALQGR